MQPFLSAGDLAFFSDRTLFDKKKEVQSAIDDAMHEVYHHIGQNLPTNAAFRDFFSVTGKLSCGENYKGYPWMSFDFPRYFDENDILAFRQFSWWGAPFHFTLHLSGKPLDTLKTDLPSRLQLINPEDCYWYSESDDPWIHHMSTPHFIPLAESWEETANSAQRKFIKLCYTLPINHFNNYTAAGILAWQQFLKILDGGSN